MDFRHLTRLHAILERAGNVAELAQPNESAPGRVGVSLGADAQGRLYVITIVFLNDISEMAGVPSPKGDVVLIQHALTFPFKATPETAEELLQFIVVLNRVLPIGSLLFDPSTGELALQYVLLSDGRDVPSQVASETVSMLDDVVRQYRQHLEAVALGEISCARLLQHFAAAALQREVVSS
jgi:hypothetical protein